MNNKIEPIKKSRLSEKVLKKLQTMIIDGTFKTGDQLPSERELSVLFQVSRASIREALRILETLGLLDTRIGVGGGTFVKKISIDALINPFSEILGNGKELIIEMLEFRRILETEIARLAALLRTEEDIASMESSIDLMREDITDGGIGIEGDTAFHNALAVASHNSVFKKMLSMAEGLLVKTRQASLQIKDQPEICLQEHVEIYKAIKKGYSELSQKLMIEHIVKAQTNIVEKVFKNEKTGIVL